ncbi:MAG: hypothetical protein GY940_27600 [bacterium]|nr:hypothetical protein [bacterium]
MTAQTYQKLISDGIKGLPTDTLAEIVDFIFFLRKRALQPEIFEEEMQISLLHSELKQLSEFEEAHLEKEFENYDKLYPRE